jgi:RimJ/RimL family protein N-acetyltransferase
MGTDGIRFKSLIGKKIILNPIQPEHREHLRQNAKDNRVWAFNTLIANYSEDLFNTWFTLAYNNTISGIERCFVISHNKQLIGSSRYYMIKPEIKELSIGFTWIHPIFWGSTVNPETKYLMINNAFESEYEKINFHVDNLNIHSQKAMEKLGATLVTKNKWTRMRPDGSIRQTYEYEIKKEKWPEISEKLIKRIV